MPRFNEIFEYCKSKCKSDAQYLKVETGGNDPKISSKMRYSELLRTRKPQTFPITSQFVVSTCPNVGGIGGRKFKCNNPIFVNSNKK